MNKLDNTSRHACMDFTQSEKMENGLSDSFMYLMRSKRANVKIVTRFVLISASIKMVNPVLWRFKNLF